MKKIRLTQDKFALVDDADYEKVSQYKWFYKIGYAARQQHIGMVEGKQIQRTVFMHRLILDAPEGLEVDHKNMDGLDNRRKNIRLATRTQNQINRGPQQDNTSGYKGVLWAKQNRKWRAYITIKGKTIHLGLYENIEDAAKRRQEVEKQLYGEFARGF
jgi:hypothetical protein